MSNRCPVCNKFAYAAESANVNGTFYHKTCMKCKTCKCNLSVSTYKLLKGTNEIYCQIHLPQPKNLQAAVTMETISAKQSHRPDLVNRQVQGGDDQRRNLQSSDTLDIRQANKTKGTLVNTNVRGCDEQRHNTGALGAYDTHAMQHAKSSQTLVNNQVRGGNDLRHNTGALSMSDTNAMKQSKSSQSLVNNQVRGGNDLRHNTQTTETMESVHLRSAPKVGVIQNPNIRTAK
ncbi:LIM zinc finger domain containing protein [Entamoeba marina]